MDGASPQCAWPEGKRFAFTIFDDTDTMTVETGRRVYGFLEDCGFRTTKSCWSFRGDPNRGKFPGETLDDADYRQWLLALESKGFDIGWHGATWHGSTRDQVAAALNRFAEVFQHDPTIATNHTGVEEAMYWGSDRLTGWRRVLYNLLTLYHNDGVYRGGIEGDVHFWGDLCQQRIRYFRDFVFQETNTLKVCPFMPYHDPHKPYVNYWFASSNGRDIASFNRRISERNQDRLEAEGGACIMYTHFAYGFCENGELNSRFRTLMTRLSKKGGWYVPVATLLDHLLAKNGHNEISNAQRRCLERKWLLTKMLVGTV